VNPSTQLLSMLKEAFAGHEQVSWFGANQDSFTVAKAICQGGQGASQISIRGNNPFDLEIRLDSIHELKKREIV